MEFLHASIALLASMVLVLAGMVGWLYWQQTRIFQNMNSIVMVIGELARPPAAYEEVAQEAAPVAADAADTAEEDDDRVSVDEEKVETIEGPPAPLDTDGLQDKTKKERQDMLSKRGIPYGKNDNKGALISLLKATA